jgi:hypothetical protein
LVRHLTHGRRSTAGGFAVFDGSLDASALYSAIPARSLGSIALIIKQTICGNHSHQQLIRESGRRVEGSHMEVMAGVVLAATAVGFVLGYGVREAISQHRRTEARRRRHV